MQDDAHEKVNDSEEFDHLDPPSDVDTADLNNSSEENNTSDLDEFLADLRKSSEEDLSD